MARDDAGYDDTVEGHEESLLLPPGEATSSDDEFPEPGNLPTFTYRSTIVGLLIGVITCLSNVYFGLQNGFGDTMAMGSSLLGYGLFRLFASRLKMPFGPKENVLIQTVSGAVASMPLTAGLVSVIVALESLITPSEGGPLHFSYLDLTIWALGLSCSGTFLAMLTKKYILEQDNLPFPSATATAAVIKTLHDEDPSSPDDESLQPHGYTTRSQHEVNDEVYDITEDRAAEEALSLPPNSVRDVLVAFVISGVITFIESFLPILHNIPFLGNYLARRWLWTFNLSPGIFGQGMVTGPVIPLHMLAGTIIGWAIISPIAKKKEWAPGDVSDWSTGSRGWTLWVGLAILLTDCLVNLLAMVFALGTVRDKISNAAKWAWKFFDQYTPQRDALSGRGDVSTSTHRSVASYKHRNYAPTHKFPKLSLKQTYYTLVAAIFASAFLCVGTSKFVFREQLPVSVILLAVVISLFLGLASIEAVGQTDYSPVSGLAKLSQFVFAFIISKDNPNRLIINLAVGAIGEAGAMQATILMFDLKTGSLLGANPFAQMSAHMIGSLFGAFLAAGFFKLYKNAYEVPGPLFQTPTAYIWVAAARLAYGSGLPKYSLTSSLIAAGITAVTTTLRIVLRGSKWQKFIPGGVAFAMGMYNAPAFTLPRVLGGVASGAARTRFGIDATTLRLVAAGLILGESILSLMGLFITPLK